MENGTEWNTFLDKKVEVIFEDGENHFKKKTGWIQEVTSTHLILRTNMVNEALNLSKILRVKEVE